MDATLTASLQPWMTNYTIDLCVLDLLIYGNEQVVLAPKFAIIGQLIFQCVDLKQLQHLMNHYRCSSISQMAPFPHHVQLFRNRLHDRGFVPFMMWLLGAASHVKAWNNLSVLRVNKNYQSVKWNIINPHDQIIESLWPNYWIAMTELLDLCDQVIGKLWLVIKCKEASTRALAHVVPIVLEWRRTLWVPSGGWCVWRPSL